MVKVEHCKEKYKDIMHVAMYVNAKKQIYPLAFGLGIGEWNPNKSN